MKKFSLITMSAILAFGLTACGGGTKEAAGGSGGSGGSSSAGGAVKIGVILPLTGDAAPLGDQSKKAIEVAVEEINAKGGIKSLNGAKLELVFGDSQGNQQAAVSETVRLIDKEKVALITGAYQSGMTLPASQEAEKKNKIWFASVPSDDSITTRGFKNVFRIADTSKMRVTTQINFMNDLKAKGTEIKTVALVYENSSWGQGVAKYWKEDLPKAGYQVVLDEPYDRKATDLTPVANKVKGANPDAILMVSYVQDATLLAKAFKQQKVTPKAFISTAGGTADMQFVKNAGEDALNWFDISAWEPDVNRPGSKELDKLFVDKFGGHPSGEQIKEYAGIYTIADALERAKSTDTEALRKALKETNLTSGPTQIYTKTIHFNEQNTLPDPSLVMAQFQKVNGKVERVTVYPQADARQGSQIIYPYKAE
ncbi:ABC transporter substrate-binding protein [Paenibacillus validus]|uniref:ABC transporter substrate-binding protein n=1 Tax=Paenibacillus TaxID=44249 RepID=UPI000FDA5849|nr:MULTISPECIES: ABC transporter substrate-binding protein [Paenibacillus]MED4602099.1 ABC transporter substrate-binding protein [Paenibacillus validus]MED4605847.1 ABC transporter substrate-binding protein [Paenibacillus validus]